MNNQETVKNIMIKAKELIKKNEYSKALSILLSILKDKKEAEIYNLIGELYHGLCENSDLYTDLNVSLL